MSVSGNTGPLGQERGILFGILIFIVTFGLYGLYWVFQTQEETRRHSGEGIGGGVGLIIYVIAGIATPFIVGSEVGRMYEKDGRQKPVSGATGFWILLPIAGPIVWWVKVQGALNRYWHDKATAAPAAAPLTA